MATQESELRAKRGMFYNLKQAAIKNGTTTEDNQRHLLDTIAQLIEDENIKNPVKPSS